MDFSLFDCAAEVRERIPEDFRAGITLQSDAVFQLPTEFSAPSPSWGWELTDALRRHSEMGITQRGLIPAASENT